MEVHREKWGVKLLRSSRGSAREGLARRAGLRYAKVEGEGSLGITEGY